MPTKKRACLTLPSRVRVCVGVRVCVVTAEKAAALDVSVAELAQKGTNYEDQRLRTMQENQDALNALGLTDGLIGKPRSRAARGTARGPPNATAPAAATEPEAPEPAPPDSVATTETEAAEPAPPDPAAATEPAAPEPAAPDPAATDPAAATEPAAIEPAATVPHGELPPPPCSGTTEGYDVGGPPEVAPAAPTDPAPPKPSYEDWPRIDPSINLHKTLQELNEFEAGVVPLGGDAKRQRLTAVDDDDEEDGEEEEGSVAAGNGMPNLTPSPYLVQHPVSPGLSAG